MRVYKWRQVVTYTVEMLDIGVVCVDTGEAFENPEEIEQSAKEWMEQAMPTQYYPEEFVTVDEGPVEFLGVELVADSARVNAEGLKGEGL